MITVVELSKEWARYHHLLLTKSITKDYPLLQLLPLIFLLLLMVMVMTVMVVVVVIIAAIARWSLPYTTQHIYKGMGNQSLAITTTTTTITTITITTTN